MVVGVGIDVCEVARFARAIGRRPGLADRLLCARERRGSLESQAGRFAAKEALAKALGAPAGLVWQDAEVVRDGEGRPSFVLRGTVAARAATLGVARVHVSIAHDAGLATAFVVCDG